MWCGMVIHIAPPVLILVAYIAIHIFLLHRNRFQMCFCLVFSNYYNVCINIACKVSHNYKELLLLFLLEVRYVLYLCLHVCNWNLPNFSACVLRLLILWLAMLFNVICNFIFCYSLWSGTEGHPSWLIHCAIEFYFIYY